MSEIKAGRSYICNENLTCNRVLSFIKGKVYTSEENDILVNESKRTHGVAGWRKYFQEYVGFKKGDVVVIDKDVLLHNALTNLGIVLKVQEDGLLADIGVITSEGNKKHVFPIKSLTKAKVSEIKGTLYESFVDLRPAVTTGDTIRFQDLLEGSNEQVHLVRDVVAMKNDNPVVLAADGSRYIVNWKYKRLTVDKEFIYLVNKVGNTSGPYVSMEAAERAKASNQKIVSIKTKF